jgi:hypothetical protein
MPYDPGILIMQLLNHTVLFFTIDNGYFGCQCESHGCGVGIVGGRVGGWGFANEGGADCVIRNGSNDGLAASVTFRSITCPFLYTVKVRLFPAVLL